jgi:putative ABC transport system substrate-binding protein
MTDPIGTGSLRHQLERRRFMAALAGGLLAAPFAARAQQPRRMPRIAYLGPTSPSLESHLVEAFRQRLRELGYTEGQNIAIDYRWAEGQDERLSELAADLVRLKVDIIVTGNTDSTLAARRATQTIPIVMVGTGDPVEAGNVTGLSTLRPDLEGKRLGLFTEAVPRLSRVAVLRDPGNPVAKSYLESIQAAAHASHVTLEPCWKSVA